MLFRCPPTPTKTPSPTHLRTGPKSSLSSSTRSCRFPPSLPTILATPLWQSSYLSPDLRPPRPGPARREAASVVIAIIDTGVDGTHPDLASKMVAGWNIYGKNSDTSDVYGHGTEVAGTAAAATQQWRGGRGSVLAVPDHAGSNLRRERPGYLLEYGERHQLGRQPRSQGRQSQLRSVHEFHRHPGGAGVHECGRGGNGRGRQRRRLPLGRQQSVCSDGGRPSPPLMLFTAGRITATSSTWWRPDAFTPRFAAEATARPAEPHFPRPLVAGRRAV